MPCRVSSRRAGNRTRTGDPNLGKVVLYQLSYSRVVGSNLDTSTETVNAALGRRARYLGSLQVLMFRGRTRDRDLPEFTTGITSIGTRDGLHFRDLMRRSLALVTLLSLVGAAHLSSQVLDDTLVPRGRARIELLPVFTSWESRFGKTAAGATGREKLGEDLTSGAAQTLFPGAESLRSAIEAMSGSAGYTAVLGEAQARVTKDITRIEFGGHVGIFDWLTIGAVLPWTRTRTSLDVAFQPDTIAGDLGRNPAATGSSGVTSFLQSLSTAESAARTNATQVCGASPGSGACTSAQTLADRTAAFLGSATTAYGASAFFPVATSATATSLSQAVSTLSADLIAAGLGGIAAPMAFATLGVSESDYWGLSAGAGVLGDSLGSVKGLWHAGDAEVSATVRLLEGAVGGSAETPPGVTYRLLATVLGRLPTGLTDSVDVFLDVGTGDGQSDLEGRLLGQATFGRHLGVQVGVRYGVQRPRTLVLRVAPPETVVAAYSTRHTVEWTPGAYLGLEVAPVWRLSDELSIAAEYRVFRKYRDAYELAGTSVGAPVDPAVLEIESGVTLHEVGGALRFDTMARWLGQGARPFQAHLRVVRAVAGGGGQTPVTTQVEFGVRLFRRLWGPS